MATNKEKKPSPSKPPNPKSIPTVVKNPLFEKHAFAIAFGLTSLIAFFIFKDYLLLKNIYLFKDIGSDTLNQFYPTMCMYSDYLGQYAFPSWSFSFGMGQNILPFFLRDPFDLFIYYGGKDHIPYLLAWKEFAKVVLTGIIFFSYLRLVVKDGFTCAVGTLLFSFSGFMILGSGWYQFSFEAFNLALLLLAFEKLFLQGKWILFPVAILLVGISQPFNLYVNGIFLSVYALMRFFELEEKFSFRRLLLLFSKMTAYALLGVLISSVFLVPNVIQLLESPRGSGTSSYANKLQSTSIFQIIDAQQLKTAISRFFSNDLMGTGINFQGWTNYLEAPLFYCGILSLIIVPLSFTLFEKRKRTIYLLFLVVWILPVVFPYLRYSFWFFTGDYYRVFSLCVSIALIYLAVQALKSLNTEIRKVNFVVLGITSLCLLIAVSTTTITEIKSGLLFFLCITLIILYSILLILLTRQKNKSTVQYVLLILLFIEFSYQGYTTSSHRKVVSASELKVKDGYNDYTVDAVSFLRARDHTFFRIDKDYSSSLAMHTSINDAMAQDYFGTSSYNSFNQINYVRFLSYCGIIDTYNELQTRWAPGVGSHYLLEDICSVKYLFLKKKIEPSLKFRGDSLARLGDVTIVENKFSLPLGYSYDHYILESDFKKLGMNYRDIVLLAAVVIPDSVQKYFVDLKQMNSIDTTEEFASDMYASVIDSLKKDTMAIKLFQQSHITGKISSGKKELLFLSIPFDKGWSASVNGKLQNILVVDGGLMGFMLNKGENNVELKFSSRHFVLSLICSLFGCVLYLILSFASWYLKPKRSA